MPEKSSARKLVEDAYKEKGQEAAIAVGAANKVKSSRVTRWIKKLNGGGGKSKRSEPAPHSVPNSGESPKRIVEKHSLQEDGHNTRWIVGFGRKFKCQLVKEGPDQSEVRFPNGNMRFVISSWLKKSAAEVSDEELKASEAYEAPERRADRGKKDHAGKSVVQQATERVLRRNRPAPNEPARRGGSGEKAKAPGRKAGKTAKKKGKR